MPEDPMLQPEGRIRIRTVVITLIVLEILAAVIWWLSAHTISDTTQPMPGT
jgi:hypothetical protein